MNSHIKEQRISPLFLPNQNKTMDEEKKGLDIEVLLEEGKERVSLLNPEKQLELLSSLITFIIKDRISKINYFREEMEINQKNLGDLSNMLNTISKDVSSGALQQIEINK